jgi:hypothetical protein
LQTPPRFIGSKAKENNTSTKMATHEKRKISQKEESFFNSHEAFSNERIRIISPSFFRRSIVETIIRFVGVAFLALVIGIIASYLYQQKKAYDHERQRQEEFNLQRMRFERSVEYAEQKIERLDQRLNYLGNENTHLRKQRDAARNDLRMIVEKKNGIIRDLEAVNNRLYENALKKVNTISLLETLERTAMSQINRENEDIDLIYRLEFLKDTFPEYESLRNSDKRR